jgi:hypothetical protein
MSKFVRCSDLVWASTTMVELSYLLMRTTGPSLDTLGVVSLVTGLGSLLDTLWVFVGTGAL